MNIKLGTRLGLSFGAVLLLAAVIALCGVGALRSVMGSFHGVTNEVLPKSEIANRNIQAAYDYARAFTYIMTSEGRADADAVSLKAAYGVLADTVKEVNDNVATLEPMLSTEEEKALLTNVKARRAAYGKSRNQVLALKKAGENDRAVALMFSETNQLQTVYIESWKQFIGHEKKLLNAGVQTAESNYRYATTALYAILAVAMAAGLSVAVLLTRWLLRSLGGEPAYAAAIANRIALGDLTIDVQAKAHDQTSLLFAMKTMRDNLERIVGQVRVGTDGIASASAQIAQGNNDLSQRTEEQAAALEETAASMEQLSATVKLNADNATQANQLALGASIVAIKGGEVVSQVTTTMKDINDSSRKIADIISVIDGIAFQTNILALNAAVEAARAGEQGRGFAVVASEVRSLAGRSADAAKEIKRLITVSVERVEQGTALVGQAGVTMTEVVSSIRRVTDVMGEISAASSEQSAGVAQVGEAIMQMDQVTQQNAALVEESAAAAESLKAQAQELVNAVSVFKLVQGSETRAAAPAMQAATVARNHAPAERRGPARAKNVTRPAFGTQAQAQAEPPTLTAPAHFPENRRRGPADVVLSADARLS